MRFHRDCKRRSNLRNDSQDRKTFDVGTNLFIGNLVSDVDEKIVYDTSSTFGELVALLLILSHHLGSKLVNDCLSWKQDSVETYMESPRCHLVLLCKVFMFANQAGLDMLETTLVALQDIALENIFDESGRKALCSDFAKLMQQGFACLPSGICLSTMGDMPLMNKLLLGKCLLYPITTIIIICIVLFSPL
ncbi:unnamed protein product [Brassica oleracea var. botrytis]